MQAAIEKVTGLFRGSAGQSTSQETDPTAANDGTTADGGEDVAAGSTRKRPIEVNSQEPDAKKRRMAHGGHEKRLMGDYDRPHDAQRLAPVPNDLDALQRQSKPMTTKPRSRGGIKPVNTLNSSPHTARASQPGQGPFWGGGVRNSIKHPTQPSRTTQGVTGSDRAHYGDGFDKNERPPKKPKLAMGHSSDPLVDDDDDVVETTITRQNGKQSRATYALTQSAPRVSEQAPSAFAYPEVRKVDQMTTVRHEKPGRKSKDGARSSQSSKSSNRATPADLPNGQAGATRNANTYPIVVLDDEPSQQHAGSGKNHSEEDEGKRRPDINLMKGIGDGEMERRPRTIRENRQAASQLAGSRNVPSSTMTAKSSQPARPRRNISQTDDGDFRNYIKSDQSARSKSPGSLRTTFSRTDAPEPTQPVQQSKPRATRRMKATSEKVSPVDDSVGSEDELTCGNTVPSRASQSPQKKNAAHSQPQNSLRGQGTQRAPSPSDLKPTQFKSGVRRAKDRRAGADDATRTLDYADADRVPIQAFYATKCVMTSGSLSLRYDEDEKVIELYVDNMVKRLPNKQCTVAITDREAHAVSWNNSSAKIHMKGSAGNLSNGHICIAFQEIAGVQWFLTRIPLVTNDRTKVSHAPDIAQLDKTFLRQASEISQKWEQDKNKAEQPHIARSSRPNDDDEEIKYETEEPPQTNSRKPLFGRLLSGGRASQRLSREATELQASPYFATSPRTTRQPKPTKPRSPSPPPPAKWTRENKPERWAHSVVYPPEGVRRVTVDFQDLERLDEGEFLNDNIISFALRRIEEKMAPEHKESVHFFNSFFYTALTTKNGKKTLNYDAVKRWTKNKDLLTVPYIVVPINIDFHWFVAIISNLPSITRKAAGLEDDDEEDAEQASGDDTASNGNVDESQMTDELAVKKGKEPTEAMDQLSLSDKGEESKPSNLDNAGDSELLDTPTTKPSPASKKSKNKAPPAPKKYDPDSPTIITLDSFGSSHTGESRFLKDYVNAEAYAKRGMCVERDQLQGMTAKGIPEQTNFCDCGVYLVGYVEEFAKDPRKFVTKVLTRQLDKQADFASFDPSAKRAQIRDELLELHKQQEAEHKAKKAAKKAAPKGDNKASSTKSSAVISAARTAETSNGEALVPEQSSAPESVQRQANEASSSTAKPVTKSEDGEELELGVPRALPTPTGQGQLSAGDEKLLLAGMEKFAKSNQGHATKGGVETNTTRDASNARGDVIQLEMEERAPEIEDSQEKAFS